MLLLEINYSISIARHGTHHNIIIILTSIVTRELTSISKDFLPYKTGDIFAGYKTKHPSLSKLGCPSLKSSQ